MKPNHVHLEGPEPKFDRWGDEYPVWYVTLCDDRDGDCRQIKAYECSSLGAAQDLGETISDERNIELVDEAIGA